MTVISAAGPELEAVREFGALPVAIPMRREMSPGADALSLLRLLRVLRAAHPMIVNASTPKAGLLGMVAAVVTRSPVRTYTVRGLRFETLRGPRRLLGILAELAAVRSSTRVFCVSESVRQRMIKSRILQADEAVVTWEPGLRLSRWAPSVNGVRAGERVRNWLGIGRTTPVIGFVGRLARDKGVSELLAVFDLVRSSTPSARLLVLGLPDEGDPPPKAALERIRIDPAIHAVGGVADPADYFKAMDVFVFPSHREGLGMAALEASASGLPVVGFAVTGMIDVVQSGISGALVPAGNITAMAARTREYLGDPALCKAHGMSGRELLEDRFDMANVERRLEQAYRELLAKLGFEL